MYRSAPSSQERAATIAFVVAVHLALGYALLSLSGTVQTLARESHVEIFDVLIPPPPPPPPPPPAAKVKPTKAVAKQKPASPPAPKNVVSKPAPVVAPKPLIVVPAKSPVVAAPKAGTGAAAMAGASTSGPGSGAGGAGNGSGGGGAGSGGGAGEGGGTGLGEARPQLRSRPLDGNDFPRALYRQAPRGGVVFLILRVGPDGVPVSCRVARSFGDAVLDAETCRLAVARLRFTPGRDEQGRAVADFFGYRQDFNTRF